MTKQARKRTPPAKATRQARTHRRLGLRLAVAGGLVAILLITGILDLSPLRDLWPFNSSPAQIITDPTAPLADFYSPEVLFWKDKIIDWADAFAVNPNVVAIVMQIESCGDPEAISPAGALGLMQVMPFHFDYGENMLNPTANVEQGMTVFHECLIQFADYDLGIAMACYNGGPSVTLRPFETWALETQAYYQWATGLWNDVLAGADESETLENWLAAGGSRLCVAAAETNRAVLAVAARH